MAERTSGNPDSPEHWLDEHGDALYAYAMMRVHHAAMAEDLVQETLLAALSAAGRFEARASMRTWLIGILKNKLVDSLRKSARETGYRPADIDEGDLNGSFDASGHWSRAPQDWGDPAILAENAALKAAMMACIAALPEKLRTPFLLSEVDGLATATVVEVLNISSDNNLWVMLSRGRERVRRCLEQSWYEGARR